MPGTIGSRRPTEVLIVGAGPTGLVLAIWLRRFGVDVRVIDKEAEPGTTSRALAVHARTLEFYRQIGLADEVVKRGLQFAAVNLWARGEHAARVELSDIGQGLSPFPYILIFPQDEHEKFLIDHLRRAGVEVERPTELLGFEDDGGRVVARLRHQDDDVETCEAAYITGCDGAHSKVREVLDTGFPGGTSAAVFYVADVELRGPTSNHEFHVALDEADLLAVFPMKGENAGRLVGSVHRPADGPQQDLTWNDVSHDVIGRMKMTIERVHWFSTHRVHHRVAEHFRRGRAFLLGDAAHVHSPVGGQGMNTGIGDAVNLAWKLAAVLGRRAKTDLLESYEPERIAFAKRLVATTDRVFAFVTKNGPVARLVRLDAVPLILPRLMSRTAARKYLFETVSQIRISYHGSQLSMGQAGSVRGGDRLPWVRMENDKSADNFAPLTSLDWQVHVYGEVSPRLAAACATHELALHAFPWTPATEKAGFARSACYLVRPDGHVAWADHGGSIDALEAYVTSRGLRCRPTIP